MRLGWPARVVVIAYLTGLSLLVAWLVLVLGHSRGYLCAAALVALIGCLPFVRAGRYLLAAAETNTHGAVQARRALGNLVLSGQRRLHFKAESNARRRLMLGAIVDLPVSVTVLTCRGLGEEYSPPVAPGWRCRR